MRELLEKLVEVLRVTGEQVAVLRHEILETRIQRLPRPPLLHHLVEGVEGIADVLALLGARRRGRAGDLVEVRLHDLLAQSLEELLEALSRLAGGELVVLEAVHAAGEMLGQQPELCPPLADDVLGHLLTAFVPRLAGLLLELVERLVLLVENLVQLVGDVPVDAIEVVLLTLFPATLPDPLEQLLHTLDVPAVAVLETLLE